MEPEDLIRIAHGEQPADLLLKNARLVNVYSSEIYPTDIAIAGEQVAALGAGYQARQILDLEGRYVCPGLIDAHVHIESSMVPPREFARVVLPHGVPRFEVLKPATLPKYANALPSPTEGSWSSLANRNIPEGLYAQFSEIAPVAEGNPESTAM